MMNTLPKMLRALGLVVALGCSAAPALAQKSEAPVPAMLTSAQPKDVYTRAKLHTELGSMYFQNGNLIVALEELTIAISIDANYAQAYSTRGLVLYYIKEFASATDRRFNRMRPSIAPRKRHQAG